jgi:hypothetical protein
MSALPVADLGFDFFDFDFAIGPVFQSALLLAGHACPGKLAVPETAKYGLF